MKLSRSEKAVLRGALATALVYLSVSIAANSAIAATTEAVTKAIQQRVCFEDFWWDRDSFQLGKTVPITLRQDDNIAYVWSEGLAVVPGASRWANFFTVFTKDDQSVVGSSYGYNLDSMQGTPDFEKKKSQVFGGKAETIQLRIPANCAPHFTEETPLKKRMLKTIETTMTNELTLFNKSGGAHYPGQLRIVIADFNADYPETQVFIPSTEQVFHVALQDAADPLSDTFLKQGEYPVRPEYDKQAIKLLGGKIIKYGIVREITLGGG
jgi:hypothetical protein